MTEESPARPSTSVSFGRSVIEAGRQLSSEITARAYAGIGGFADAEEPTVERLASTMYDKRRSARQQILASSTVLFHTESWIETLLTINEYSPPTVWWITMIIVGLVTWFSIWCQTHRHIEHDIDSRIHDITIGLISLLIVFRTSQAYARWWEGRTLWGTIVNSTRNLASNAVTWMQDHGRYQRVVICTIAFAYSVKQTLRGEKLFKAEMDGLFDEDEIERINEFEHIPMLFVDEIRRCINAELAAQGPNGSLTPTSYNWDFAVSTDIATLVAALGGCERIAKTPMPFGYLSQLRIFMVIWILSWPFALTADYGWWTVAVVGFVSLIMMKLEKMAVQIEHPFGTDSNDLPTDGICVTIERNLLEILRRAEYISSDARLDARAPLNRIVPPRASNTNLRSFMTSRSMSRGSQSGRAHSTPDPQATGPSDNSGPIPLRPPTL